MRRSLTAPRPRRRLAAAARRNSPSTSARCCGCSRWAGGRDGGAVCWGFASRRVAQGAPGRALPFDAARRGRRDPKRPARPSAALPLPPAPAPHRPPPPPAPQPYCWKSPRGHFPELLDALTLLNLREQGQVEVVRQVGRAEGPESSQPLRAWAHTIPPKNSSQMGRRRKGVRPEGAARNGAARPPPQALLRSLSARAPRPRRPSSAPPSRRPSRPRRARPTRRTCCARSGCARWTQTRRTACWAGGCGDGAAADCRRRTAALPCVRRVARQLVTSTCGPRLKVMNGLHERLADCRPHCA